MLGCKLHIACRVVKRDGVISAGPTLHEMLHEHVEHEFFIILLILGVGFACRPQRCRFGLDRPKMKMMWEVSGLTRLRTVCRSIL